MKNTWAVVDGGNQAERVNTARGHCRDEERVVRKDGLRFHGAGVEAGWGLGRLQRAMRAGWAVARRRRVRLRMVRRLGEYSRHAMRPVAGW